jgi:RNA recognition motif-containing protein
MNMDWVEQLLNDEPSPIPAHFYCEKEFNDKLEDRRIEISNFDPDNTTEEEIAAICGHYGETAWIDITQQSLGRIIVKFFDLRSAYILKFTTIRLRGFTWIIQFRAPEVFTNLANCMNEGKIAIVPFCESVTTEMIHEEFARFGPIREVRSWRNHRFVEYWDDRACTKAIAAMHGTYLFGNKISVKLSRPYFRHRLNAEFREERLPTVARTSRKANEVQLEIASPLCQNRGINREPKCKKPTIVFERNKP